MRYHVTTQYRDAVWLVANETCPFCKTKGLHFEKDRVVNTRIKCQNQLCTVEMLIIGAETPETSMFHLVKGLVRKLPGIKHTDLVKRVQDRIDGPGWEDCKTQDVEAILKTMQNQKQIGTLCPVISEEFHDTLYFEKGTKVSINHLMVVTS